MPGTNAGTGAPLTLRCALCRKSMSLARFSGRNGTNLEATGRTKPAIHRHVRQTTRKIEYHCLDCGHVGWTQHIDAERLIEALATKDAAAHAAAMVLKRRARARKWRGR